MKSITLRKLLREPLQVKRWTRAGRPIRVTDGGVPLWILQPADTPEDDRERRRATEQVLAEVLSERPSRISAARILEESRR